MPGFLKRTLPTIATSIIVGVLAGGASLAVASLTFSGTTIISGSGVSIDASGTISIGTSTATGITIGNANATTSFFGNVGIGTSSLAAQLDVAGRTPTALLGSVSVGTQPQGLFVRGNYAYVANKSSPGTLNILDISNPASPVAIGSITASSNDGNFNNIFVQGNYAYATERTNDQIYVFDVSNPYAPSIAGKVTVTGCDPLPLYVQGRYLYTSEYCTGPSHFDVVDIANPAAPTVVGSVLTGGGSYASGLWVQGKYAYLVGGGNTETVGVPQFQIIDISTPTAPIVVGTSSIINQYTTGISIVVRGRYAYITLRDDGNPGQGTSGLQIYDVSNPASPTLVGYSYGIAGARYQGLSLQDRYAYISDSTNKVLYVFDVSNPASPTVVGSLSSSASLWKLSAQGRYLYGIDNANSALDIYDTGGAYVQQLEAGGIETGSLTVQNSTQILQDLNVSGGATIGRSLMVDGPLSVFGGASSSVFTINQTGNVGLGTTAPLSELNVAGLSPQASTSSLVLLGSNSIIGGSASGTFLAANPTSTYSGDFINFEVNSSTVFLLNSSGSLSIATGTPAANALLTIATSTNILTVLSNGRVGIGTSTPVNALDINGYALFSQSYGSLAEFTGATTTGSTINATNANTFYPWTGASSTISHWAGTSYVTSTIAAGATSSLTIGASGAGTYRIQFSGAVSVNATGDVVHCSAVKNGTPLPEVTIETKLTNSGDERAIAAGPAYLSLVPNDVLSLSCDDETASGKVITFDHVNFGIDRIGR